VTDHDRSGQLSRARALLAGRKAWLLSDGKAGDRAQLLGLAERLNLQIEEKILAQGAAFALFAPWGPLDPALMPGKPGSPLAPPFPDLVIGTGRRVIPAIRALRKETNRPFTMILKDPRTGAGSADLIWVPKHDRLRGTNVVTTLLSPHRVSPEALQTARTRPAPFAAPEGAVIAGVLLGGNSKHHRFTDGDCAQLVNQLAGYQAEGAFLVVTPSRRTPAQLAQAVQALCAENHGWYWDGTGENPYLAILAQADHLIVTADSVNMLGEALAAGKPAHLFSPSGGHAKISAFVNGLIDHGAVRPMISRLETWPVQPLDATPDIAIALADAFTRHRASLSKDTP
jgi:uncharacterized protein